MYAVILAGGGGTRLWPLSDPQHPKPFLPLLPDGSLLQRTVSRLLDGPELDMSAADVTIVTDRRYEKLARDQVDVTVISEPMGRNTAAAIALAALAVERDPDEVMVVLPADHLIALEGVFRGVLANARDELATGALGIDSPIVTIGAHPTGPATQYGYLVPDLDHGQQRRLRSYVLDAFVEKPDLVRATELIAKPGVAWNAGIFIARRRAMLDALSRHTDLVGILTRALESPDALEAAYSGINPISIDYAVMQQAAAEGQVVMAAADVGWSDVGTWTALLDSLVGGYTEPARVVPPGEAVNLGPTDVCVLRADDDRHLSFESGPGQLLDLELPIALLPNARVHVPVIRSLVMRVADWEAELKSTRVGA